MKKIIFTFLATFLFLPFFLLSEETIEKKEFIFKYKNNDSYRILSTVQEDVYFNQVKHHHAEIVNRISVQVTDVDESTGSAEHNVTFMTSENSTAMANGNVFSYGEEYKSIFTRDKTGRYAISDEYFMPTVRDVPIFPSYAIAPGDEWTAEGHEAHDLRRTFNITKPYKVPFTAFYKYVGPKKITTEVDGKTVEKTLDIFEVKYNLHFSLEDKNQFLNGIEVPIETDGYSHQTIFWDSENGAINNYYENFQIVLKTNANNFFTFEGTANAEVTKLNPVSTEKNAHDMKEKISDLHIEDVSVKQNEKGLTLSLNNIQFKADSAILSESEKIKLQKLSPILSEYKDNDLLVSGHTALRGTENERQALSEKRAAAVADYLIQLGVCDKYHIFTQGFGSKIPVDTNATEDGRKKNRRVEITIMEK